jgi:mannose-6-phosphate isomerase-like protein (cupin superfamily)
VIVDRQAARDPWSDFSNPPRGTDGYRHRMDATERTPVHLAPGEGRRYGMGRIDAVFKADGPETAGRYSISEWWLDPHTAGPGAHTHPEDDVFYVLDGTMSFLLGDRWVDAPKGSFVLAPGGTVHDFENRTGERAGALNVSAPGGFEPHMPGIAEWFRGRDA